MAVDQALAAGRATWAGNTLQACASVCSGGANMLHTQAYARTDANACDHAEDLTSVFDFAGLRTNAILKIVILSDDGE